jgi:hypothetical protein
MPAVGEIWQFTLVSSYQGQTCENVIHMRSVALLTPTAAMLQGALDQWFNLQKATQVNAVSYRPCRLKQMTPLAFDEHLVLPSSTVGISGDVGVNTTLAAVITKRTGQAGKTHRGRMYLPGFSQNWGVDIISAATGPTILQVFCDGLLSTFGEGGTNGNFVAGIYSRVIGGSIPFTVAGWQAITRWEPQFLVGNQRRRRLFRGI